MSRVVKLLEMCFTRDTVFLLSMADKKVEPKKEEQAKQPEEEGLLHAMKAPEGPLFTRKLAIILAAVLIFGAGSGFVATKLTPKAKETGTVALDGNVSEGSIKKGETYGSDNTSAFRDTAEGVLKEGGKDGEGSHHFALFALESW